MENLHHNPPQKGNRHLRKSQTHWHWTEFTMNIFVNWCTGLMYNKICFTMIMQIKILHNHFFLFYKRVLKIYFHKHFRCNLGNDKNTKLSLVIYFVDSQTRLCTAEPGAACLGELSWEGYKPTCLGPTAAAPMTTDTSTVVSEGSSIERAGLKSKHFSKIKGSFINMKKSLSKKKSQLWYTSENSKMSFPKIVSLLYPPSIIIHLGNIPKHNGVFCENVSLFNVINLVIQSRIFFSNVNCEKRTAPRILKWT